MVLRPNLYVPSGAGSTFHVHFRDVRRPQGVSMAFRLVFTGWMAITSAMSLVPEPTWTKYVDVLKVIGMTFVVAALVRTREEIMGLLVAMVASMGFFGTKGGYYDTDALMDELTEFISYHAIDESADMAETRGAYETFKGSGWSQGGEARQTAADRGAAVAGP